MRLIITKNSIISQDDALEALQKNPVLDLRPHAEVQGRDQRRPFRKIYEFRIAIFDCEDKEYDTVI